MRIRRLKHQALKDSLMKQDTFRPSTKSAPEIKPATYVTTEQAAAHLGLSKSWLEKLRLSGDGPPYYPMARANHRLIEYYLIIRDNEF